MELEQGERERNRAGHKGTDGAQTGFVMAVRNRSKDRIYRGRKSLV